MKRPYQVIAVVLFLLSVFVVRESLDLTYYDQLGPGPGLPPFWLGILLGGLSVGLFYQATWGKVKDEPMPANFFASRVGYSRIAAIIVATAAVVVLLEPLGFRLTILLYLLFLMFGLGRVNLIATVLLSLAGSFGLFFLFVDCFKVVLPTGMFGF